MSDKGKSKRIEVRSEESFSSDVKHLGVSDGMWEKLKVRCPRCDTICSPWYSLFYYPLFGEMYEYTCWCGHCDEIEEKLEDCQFKIKVRLDLVVTLEGDAVILPKEE